MELVIGFSILAASVLVPMLLLVRVLCNIVPYTRVTRRARKGLYGPICPRCNHMLDLTRRRTCEFYDLGQCPSCGASLVRLRDR